MKTELTGRVALVTGGTSGIGAAICRQLADSGARVATNYRNEDKARQWLSEVRAQGYDFQTYGVDVRDFEGCGQMVAAIEKDLGPIDIVVNNAGITMDVTFRKMAREQWDTVLGINLDGLFNVTRQVIGGMIDRGFGRIINISSINAQKGQIGQANYTTTKAGMHGFTMSLAQEVARKGITVNTVSPGYIATEMVMAVPENIRNQIIAQVPVGRLGEAQEVAYLVDFLVSDKACFITGANLAMNGGQHMM
ncbi:MAG: acetoacetyl-CoA reductase [Pseudomonadota bacterium]|nr:acetoacetyl-CoA reductase [Gammaproteobacteria bacterium]MDQ3582566.1 acetoacetyl-CoA reductase [Pseudomonadota bacterium]